jgi:hypothetical protein
LSLKCPDQLWGPTSLLFKGYRAPLLGVKQLRHEAGHSPPSSADVKNEWNCNSIPPCLYGMHRDNFMNFVMHTPKFVKLQQHSLLFDWNKARVSHKKTEKIQNYGTVDFFIYG